MQIEVLQENLVKAISLLQKIVPTKPSLPILSSILLTASETDIILSATDLFVGLRIKVAGTVITPGSVVIPGKILSESVTLLSPGKITLESKETAVQIITQDGKTSLQCQAASEYPPFPEVTGDTLQLPWELIDHSVNQIGFCVASDAARPVLTAVLWEVTPDFIKLIGTDGFRLAVFTHANEIAITPTSLLLPAKSLQEVWRSGQANPPATVAATISTELKQVLFTLPGIEVFVRLIEGEYPPYQKILPSSFPLRVVLDTQELISHLRRAQVLARDASNIIQWEFTPDQLIFTAVSPSFGTHTSHLDIKHLGETTAGQIAFNIRYVLEYLQTVAGDQTWFGMSESLKPALFKPEENSPYQYVVMPFRVNK